jgi:hypothetical protein
VIRWTTPVTPKNFYIPQRVSQGGRITEGDRVYCVPTSLWDARFYTHVEQQATLYLSVPFELRRFEAKYRLHLMVQDVLQEFLVFENEGSRLRRHAEIRLLRYR